MRSGNLNKLLPFSFTSMNNYMVCDESGCWVTRRHQSLLLVGVFTSSRCSFGCESQHQPPTSPRTTTSSQSLLQETILLNTLPLAKPETVIFIKWGLATQSCAIMWAAKRPSHLFIAYSSRNRRALMTGAVRRFWGDLREDSRDTLLLPFCT